MNIDDDHKLELTNIMAGRELDDSRAMIRVALFKSGYIEINTESTGGLYCLSRKGRETLLKA